VEEQSYAKHAKVVPLYHLVLFAVIVVAFIGSLVNLYRRFAGNNHVGRLSAELIVLIAVALMLLFWFARIFPLKAGSGDSRGRKSPSFRIDRQAARSPAHDQTDHRPALRFRRRIP